MPKDCVNVPTNDKSGKPRKTRQDGFYEKLRKPATFVRFEPSEDELKKLKSTEFNEVQAMDALIALIEQGYKVTFRWDDYSGTHAAWAVAPDKENDNAGLILSARGSTPLKSLKKLCWLHFERFHQMWPREISSSVLDMDD